MFKSSLLSASKCTVLSTSRVAVTLNKARCFSSGYQLFNEAVAPKEAPAAEPLSYCKAGTKLNLKVYKQASLDPVALEDSEYPEWLWKLLDKKAQADILASDPIKFQKKVIRKQNIENIKQKNFFSKM